MQPTRAIWRKCADLLAADTTSLAAITAMNLHLAAAPFTPSLDMVLGDFTEATFTGSAAIPLGTGTQPVAYDAGDGLLTITLKEPAGGFHWECTADPVSPETIYGVYLTDSTDAVLYGAALLDAPVTISAADQSIDVGSETFKFLTSSPF